MSNFSLDFYKNKKVLITGHTGFKGTWMCKVLADAGADVTGYSLKAPTEPSLFELIHMEEKINSIIGDIRDLEHLKRVFDEVRPEIVIHMAAQPIVRESYRNPVMTYETNVMGTVNVLECVRLCDSVKSVVNVTTDKVYMNGEREEGYREDEELCGYDPYSNSKSCSELVTYSYKKSFFGGESGIMDNGRRVAVTTCRAGNVIGGGDFAADRIIPDCVRAVMAHKEIIVRNPYSVRPYQHVLEPVMVYLMVACRQYDDLSLAGCYNVGPDDADCITTGELVTLFCDKWNSVIAENDSITDSDIVKDNDRVIDTERITDIGGASWKNVSDNGPHEAGFLKLNCNKLKSTFGWVPRWNIEETIAKIAEWTRAYLLEEDIEQIMALQISNFMDLNI